MKIRRFMKNFRCGEKGFTLIELLVVVAILGVLAAVIIPNVAKFIGTGTVESANTEVHNIQTAVIAYMVDTNSSTFDDTVGPATTTGPEVFLLNQANLQATYTFADGALTTDSDYSSGKWKDLTWSDTTKTWTE